MKLKTRLLALLLCLCLTCSMSSCMLASEFGNAVLDMMEDFTTGDPNGGDSAEFLLDYTLTDADHEKFTQLLAECETLVLDGTDIAAIETAIEKMEEQ